MSRSSQSAPQEIWRQLARVQGISVNGFSQREMQQARIQFPASL